MKRVFAIFICFVLLFSCAASVSAHSGGTDSIGGHYDSSTGEYHYHHGYPAHQHPGGKCPYDFKDKTNSSSDSDMSFGDYLAIVMLIGLVLLIAWSYIPPLFRKKTSLESPSSVPPSHPLPSKEEPKNDLHFSLYTNVLERFNKYYDLGLLDGDIYEIAASSSPWEKLEEYVTPGTPSIEESIDSLIRTAHTLAHGIGLDENTAEDLESSMLSFIDELFNTGDYEEILTLYTLNEDNCTPETHYLVGKINYFHILLAFLDAYADKNADDHLKSKCHELFEKNQSIF
jgi:hypothetical protein